jgi:hypothetical protein
LPLLKNENAGHWNQHGIENHMEGLKGSAPQKLAPQARNFWKKGRGKTFLMHFKLRPCLN